MDMPFDESIESHADFMRRLSRSLLGHEADAEDLAQSVHLGLLQSSQDEPSPTRHWLARVLRRRSVNVLRDRTTRQFFEADAARPEAISDPAQRVERLEMQRTVIDAVLALNETYREVIDLRYYEGLGPTEIAKRIQVPVSTVKTRLQRALERLRRELDDTCNGHRETWCGLLAPLVGDSWTRPVATTAALSPALGVLMISAKFLLLPAAIALGLVGALLWMDSEPGASVGLNPAEGAHESTALVASDSQGARPPAPQRLAIQIPSRGDEPELPRQSSATANADWIVSGTLRDALGAPVPHGMLAYSFIAPAPVSGNSVPMQCDENGHFSFPLLAPEYELSPHCHGEYQVALRAWATDYQPTVHPRRLPALARGSTTLVEWDPSITRGPSIRGRVVDGTGQPVPGAQLAVALSEHSAQVGEVTDANGTYAVPVEAAEVKFVRATAWHPTFGTGSSPLLDVGVGDVQIPDILLRATHRIEGRLTFPDGVPISNLEVAFRSASGEKDVTLAHLVAFGSPGEGLNRGSFRTDEDGRFLVDGVAEGDYKLTILDGVVGAESPPELGAASTGVFFEATIPLHSVRLDVVDDAGLPLPGAHVSLRIGLGGVDAFSGGAGGNMHAWVVPGEWAASATFDGTRGARSRLSVGDLQYITVHRLLLDFETPMGTIQVRAKNERGAPLAGCRLLLSEVANPRSRSQFDSIRLDSEGTSVPVPVGFYTYRVGPLDGGIDGAYDIGGFERSIDGELEVLADETLQLAPVLPLAGRLRLNCSTTGGAPAVVLLEVSNLIEGGKPTRHTLATPIEKGTRYGHHTPGEPSFSELMEPGTWDVRLFAKDYEDHRATVQVLPGQLTELNVPMIPKR